ncbi:helix-turn-helix domain-containing protein [Streptomyces sp. NPDC012617]|uniref:helix-turn-helix domain-containing protein n=1 Tax=Streptomyces TaxID=1883 RepID=UPI0033C4A0E9
MSTVLTPAPHERRGTRHALTRRPRLRGDERASVRTQLVEKYGADQSIRALAAEFDLSYGLTRTLLLEAEVELRHRPRRLTEAGQ